VKLPKRRTKPTARVEREVFGASGGRGISSFES
jgi:hypothetical protein